MIIIWILIGLISIILLITLIETLIWWYIWSNHPQTIINPQTSWKNALIFLTGISDYAEENLQFEQIELLQNIGNHFNLDMIITAPFPYEKSTNQTFNKLDIWRKIGFKELPLWLISLHNFWQTILVIGLEKTYGDTIANCIINGLGNLPESKESTLWLICGSIGANLALASAPKLKNKLQINLIIISYGGFFKASQGFDNVEKFYHLIGKKDTWTKLSKIIFPGRYLPIGTLQKAIKENRFIVKYTGNHQHLEYLSDRLSYSQAQTYRELTLNTIIKLSIWQKKISK